MNIYIEKNLIKKIGLFTGILSLILTYALTYTTNKFQCTAHLNIMTPAMQELLDDFKYYKITDKETANSKQTDTHHTGDLYQHSLWTAISVIEWWNKHSPWVSGIDKRYKRLSIIAAILHDVGKAGDWKFQYRTKPDHPIICFQYIANIRPYTMGNGKKFSFKNLFQELKLTNEDQKILAILVGIHWEFGNVLKRLHDDKHNSTLTDQKRASLKHIFITDYLVLLQSFAQKINYNKGIIDDQLLRLALLISAADVRGARKVYYLNSIINPPLIEPHPAPENSVEPFIKYKYDTVGLQVRQELLNDFLNFRQQNSKRLILSQIQ